MYNPLFYILNKTSVNKRKREFIDFAVIFKVCVVQFLFTEGLLYKLTDKKEKVK